jgi:hypothetical protein
MTTMCVYIGVLVCLSATQTASWQLVWCSSLVALLYIYIYRLTTLVWSAAAAAAAGGPYCSYLQLCDWLVAKK